MKPFFFTCILLASFAAHSQDTLLPDEDQILQRIEFGTPSDYAWLIRTKTTDSHTIEERNCLHYLGDSLFTGVIRTDIYDSLYRLTVCTNGQPTGEELTMCRFARNAEFTADRYTYRSSKDPDRLHFRSFYPNYRTKAIGCLVFDPCPTFDYFFGANIPDCESREYYEDGTLKESYRIDGTKYFREKYHPNGKLMELQQTDRAGHACGTWKQYSASGKRTGKITFEGGEPKGYWDGQRMEEPKK